MAHTSLIVKCIDGLDGKRIINPKIVVRKMYRQPERNEVVYSAPSVTEIVLETEGMLCQSGQFEEWGEKELE